MRTLVGEYDELKVRIDSGPDGTFRVHASTDLGSVSGSFELPFAELEVENFILRVSRSRGRRRLDASALGDAKRFGGPLFKALFRDQVNGIYHDALSEARSKGRGLRITLCLSEAPELMDVPWEYLFDEPDFLAASAFTPVVRYLDLSRGHRPLKVEPPLRILGVVSSPSDYDRLDVERERANLERALSGLTADGSVELHWLEKPSLGGLLRKLQADTFHGLHYIGHGTYDERADEGVLLFEDENGRGRPVSGDKLGMILHDFTSLRLAVLNACEGARTSRSDPFAGVAGSLVRRDIPAVVAMQFEISDEAAIAFAGGFYEALAMGAAADTSVAAARLAMLADRNDDIEWGTPVLFMRVADGRLFELGERPARVPGPLVPAVDEPPALSAEPDLHEPEDGGPERTHRRWQWLLPIPIIAALAVLLVIVLRPAPSPASVAKNWLKAFDDRNYKVAASYWRPTAFWTGLKGHTDVLTTQQDIVRQIQHNAKCHKLTEAVVIGNTPGTVELQVLIDRAQPGRSCHAQGKVWYEDYLIEGGHIKRLLFRFPPPGTPGAAAPSRQSSSSSSSTPAGGTSTSGGPGSGSSSASSASGEGTSTQPAETPATAPSASPTTTTGTVPTPPTSTAPSASP